jgi:hypothetical protein
MGTRGRKPNYVYVIISEMKRQVSVPFPTSEEDINVMNELEENQNEKKSISFIMLFLCCCM